MAEARRTIDLLWFPEAVERKRGRRPGLSVARVVDTGIALADAEGLDAVSMRRVAGELGVVPMTLYTYVPDKATLLELMLDRVYLAMPRVPLPDRPWRERLTAIAEENRALVENHPWVAAMPANRPPLGPGLMAKYEHELRAFDGCGLDDVEIDSALTFLIGFVQSAARAAADARAAAGRSHETDWAWWQERGPVFEAVFDRHAYPTATRVGAAAGAALGTAYDPAHAYAFGLQRVLDGLGALIDSRRSGDAGR
ncbi:TetR/AcrR family transcriptional regulator [Actinoplanes teichomyceticus]|uniref:TetR family transcriptional regulator n=1 Tax=Actinoplanes teichomyceticus TaxID=1867 RepID=A0A561WS25_ACTTI|nr:TetR/AcrR family transcriptional regulator [Actinoplanes teichomyceticus]TWG26670.1 TetR family transcriptional regulator [Actinoplanes teichomyceticus]GIF15071.1 TetR family transcriptional regulator [Actinoplanes teichomyceticus]